MNGYKNLICRSAQEDGLDERKLDQEAMEYAAQMIFSTKREIMEERKVNTVMTTAVKHGYSHEATTDFSEITTTDKPAFSEGIGDMPTIIPGDKISVGWDSNWRDPEKTERKIEQLQRNAERQRQFWEEMRESWERQREDAERQRGQADKLRARYNII